MLSWKTKPSAQSACHGMSLDRTPAFPKEFSSHSTHHTAAAPTTVTTVLLTLTLTLTLTLPQPPNHCGGYNTKSTTPDQWSRYSKRSSPVFVVGGRRPPALSPLDSGDEGGRGELEKAEAEQLLHLGTNPLDRVPVESETVSESSARDIAHRYQL